MSGSVFKVIDDACSGYLSRVTTYYPGPLAEDVAIPETATYSAVLNALQLQLWDLL